MASVTAEGFYINHWELAGSSSMNPGSPLTPSPAPTPCSAALPSAKVFPIPQELPRSGKQNVFFGPSFEGVRERMTEDRAVDPVPLGTSKHDLGGEVDGFRSQRRD